MVRIGVLTDIPEDPLLTQLKKTQANISIWDLIASSKKHRDLIIKNLDDTSISPETSPEELTAMIGHIHFGNVITFADMDLPPFGSDHNEAIYLKLRARGRPISRVLEDGGSALNLMPGRIMGILVVSTRPEK